MYMIVGLRNISYHSVSGSSKKEELASFACQELANYVKQESKSNNRITLNQIFFFLIDLINLFRS